MSPNVPKPRSNELAIKDIRQLALPISNYARISLFETGFMYLNTTPAFTGRKTPQVSFFARLEVLMQCFV